MLPAFVPLYPVAFLLVLSAFLAWLREHQDE